MVLAQPELAEKCNRILLGVADRGAANSGSLWAVTVQCVKGKQKNSITGRVGQCTGKKVEIFRF